MTNKIDIYLNSLDNKRTIRDYKHRLNNYFKVVKSNPDEYINRLIPLNNPSDPIKYNKLSDILISDMLKFFDSLTEKKLSPMTKRSYSSTVRDFLSFNNIVMTNGITKTIKRKTGRARVTHVDGIITKQMLREILSHADTLEKALFTTIAHSGMRIEEATYLTVDDIDFNHKPVMITLNDDYCKFKQGRICFTSNEATGEILKWLEVRDEYLSHVTGFNFIKNKKYAFDKSSNRIFQFTETSFIRRWNKLLKKAGYDGIDPNSNFHTFRQHNLRKYFISNMDTVMPERILGMIVGHKGYLPQYHEKDINEMSEAYIKAIPKILLYEEVEKDTTSRIEDMQHQLEQQNKLIQSLIKRLDKQTSNWKRQISPKSE